MNTFGDILLEHAGRRGRVGDGAPAGLYHSQTRRGGGIIYR